MLQRPATKAPAGAAGPGSVASPSPPPQLARDIATNVNRTRLAFPGAKCTDIVCAPCGNWCMGLYAHRRDPAYEMSKRADIPRTRDNGRPAPRLGWDNGGGGVHGQTASRNGACDDRRGRRGHSRALCPRHLVGPAHNACAGGQLRARGHRAAAGGASRGATRRPRPARRARHRSHPPCRAHAERVRHHGHHGVRRRAQRA